MLGFSDAAKLRAGGTLDFDAFPNLQIDLQTRPGFPVDLEVDLKIWKRIKIQGPAGVSLGGV